MPCPLHTAQLALVRRGVTDQSGCVHRTRFKRDELQIIFNLIDTDSSGEIDIEELIDRYYGIDVGEKSSKSQARLFAIDRF